MINATLQPDFDLKDEVSDFKKKRIREEACKLFYELGYESTTLDAVAKRLKVTKPFLYKHYDNRLLQPANAGTIGLHFLTGLFFCAGIWLG